LPPPISDITESIISSDAESPSYGLVVESKFINLIEELGLSGALDIV